MHDVVWGKHAAKVAFHSNRSWGASSGSSKYGHDFYRIDGAEEPELEGKGREREGKGTRIVQRAREENNNNDVPRRQQPAQILEGKKNRMEEPVLLALTAPSARARHANELHDGHIRDGR